MTKQHIPDGFVKDARGRLVPQSMVKPVDQLRDQTVQALVDHAKRLQAQLTEFKTRAFADIAAFVDASHEQYGVKAGGSKGNITLITFDGRFKVVRQIAEHIQFDERLQAAKELIDECIREWTQGSSDEIKALINEAFQVDKEGNVNPRAPIGGFGFSRIKLESGATPSTYSQEANFAQATETNPGLAKVATQALTNAGTDDDQLAIVDSLFLGHNDGDSVLAFVPKSTIHSN